MYVCQHLPVLSRNCPVRFFETHADRVTEVNFEALTEHIAVALLCQRTHRYAGHAWRPDDMRPDLVRPAVKEHLEVCNQHQSSEVLLYALRCLLVDLQANDPARWQLTRSADGGDEQLTVRFAGETDLARMLATLSRLDDESVLNYALIAELDRFPRELTAHTYRVEDIDVRNVILQDTDTDTAAGLDWPGNQIVGVVRRDEDDRLPLISGRDRVTRAMSSGQYVVKVVVGDPM